MTFYFSYLAVTVVGVVAWYDLLDNLLDGMELFYWTENSLDATEDVTAAKIENSLDATEDVTAAKIEIAVVP